MCSIVHEEEYYKNSIKTMGFNVEELNHVEVSILKASLLSTEADAIIDFAINAPERNISEFKDTLIHKASKIA